LELTEPAECLLDSRRGPSCHEALSACEPLVRFRGEQRDVTPQIDLQARPGDLQMLLNGTCRHFRCNFAKGTVFAVKACQLGKHDIAQPHAPPALVREVPYCDGVSCTDHRHELPP